MASSAPIPILLVDDDRIHSRLLRARLEREGYAVRMASSGEEGLALARQERPVVILCDWQMEGMDGVAVCRAVRAEPELASIYFILLTSRSRVEDRVQGLDSGADDFLSKPVDQEELLARVRSGVRLHQANERLQATADELQRQKNRLDAELAEAAGYVQSLLPAPIPRESQASITVQTHFVPCHELGGDVFDYFWIDEDHFAIYLADASGHGLAAAFPTISVHNVLRSRSLGVDLRRPAAVLAALNGTFEMERQQGRYITIWYGVYARRAGILRFASAGHPPALLWSEDSELLLSKLSGHGMGLGLFEDARYVATSVELKGQVSLLLYSDGIYEVPTSDGCMWSLPEFIALVNECRPLLGSDAGLGHLVEQVSLRTGHQGFADDYALVQVTFNPPCA
ncbi:MULTISPECIES: PP2C family protein-serine/threonine phosphatase [Aphanothece]|uniref:PP2C family protein-serine/threonine phosphatase n=1 Tax=Aphanothece TaxID=1121 RepID=UPI003984C79D